MCVCEKLVRLVLLFDFDVFHCLRTKLLPVPAFPNRLRESREDKQNDRGRNWEKDDEVGKKKVGCKGAKLQGKWGIKQEVMEGCRRDESLAEEER